ncbi:MAG: IPT/TIG domain-containing protein [Polyangiaceae bacterium]
MSIAGRPRVSFGYVALGTLSVAMVMALGTATGCGLAAEDPGEVNLATGATKKSKRPATDAGTTTATPVDAAVAESPDDDGILDAGVVATPTSDGGGSFPPVDAAVVTPAGPQELLSLNPASAPANERDLLIVVGGKGFTATSIVTFGGEPLTTIFDSPTSLRATVPAAKLDSAGLYPVLVSGPGGEKTAAIMFTVTLSDQAVIVNSVTPASSVEGTGPVGITLSGDGFDGLPTVLLNGKELTNVRVVSKSTLTATIPPTALTVPGSYPVTVSLTPTGAPSVPIAYEIQKRPAPEMISVRETATNAPVTNVTVNRGDLAVTCTGARFVAGSKLLAVGPSSPDGGQELATTVVSDTVVRATVPAALWKKTGVVELRAFVPSGTNGKIFAPANQWWSVTVSAAQTTNGGGTGTTPPAVVPTPTGPTISSVNVMAADVPPACPGWPCVFRGRTATAVGTGFVANSTVFLMTPNAYWQVAAQPADAMHVRFAVPTSIPSAVYQVVVCNAGTTNCAGSPRLLGAW